MRTDIVYPGTVLFGDRPDEFYEVVKFLSPGLYLDAGAAAGKVTRRLAGNSPSSRVIAFEPFPGNIPHFGRNTAALANVQLIQKAVADFDGKGRLFVNATLKGTERGWEGYEGYSSAGTLISQSDPRWKHAKSEEVDVCSIDSVVEENVRFLKIDIQGGEEAALKGAQRVISQHGIDVMYIEFEGNPAVLQFLFDHGYTVFDTDYIYSPKEGGPSPQVLSNGLKVSNLSSGRQVFRGPISKRPLASSEYLSFMRGFGHWALQTDLVAVREAAMPAVLAACAEWMAEKLRRSAA